MENIINKFIVSVVIAAMPLTFSRAIAAADLQTANDSYPVMSIGTMLLAGGIIALPALFSSSGSSSSNHALPCPANLQTILNTYRQQHNIPAISLSVNPASLHNQATYNCYSGTYAKDSSVPIDAHSRFAIASLTKAIVATTILKLEEQKKLNINDPLSISLHNQYPNWNNRTIKEILNMTSEIPEYFVPTFTDQVINFPTKVWSLSDLADYVYTVTANYAFKPERTWHYSNTNYELAGLVMEAASGKNVKENLQELIFSPLNMTNSIYTPEVPAKNLPNMVRGYTNDQHNPFYDLNILDFNLSIANTAGAIVSPPEDYLKFVLALFSGRLLADQQFKELTSLVCMDIDFNHGKCTPGDPIAPEAKAGGYGLGIEWFYNKYLDKFYWWHNGTHPGGYHNTFTYVPENGFALVILTDLNDEEIDDYDHLKLTAQIYSYFYPNTKIYP
jgi:D-alanyl-D-alanine carboxypeptidase